MIVTFITLSRVSCLHVSHQQTVDCQTVSQQTDFNIIIDCWLWLVLHGISSDKSKQNCFHLKVHEIEYYLFGSFFWVLIHSYHLVSLSNQKARQDGVVFLPFLVLVPTSSLSCFEVKLKPYSLFDEDLLSSLLRHKQFPALPSTFELSGCQGKFPNFFNKIGSEFFRFS